MSTVTDIPILKAKGNFNTKSEQELKQLLRSGINTNDSAILELRPKIESERIELTKDHIKSLCGAILHSITAHEKALVRCVAPTAYYNAGRAIAMASDICKSKGTILVSSISIEYGNLGELKSAHHVKSVAAMLYTVIAVKET